MGEDLKEDGSFVETTHFNMIGKMTKLLNEVPKFPYRPANCSVCKILVLLTLYIVPEFPLNIRK